MKKFLSALLILCLTLSLLAGCSPAASEKAAPSEENGSGKIKVVTTIFPLYDWVREIAGDKVDLTLLLDNGVDLHSYQPTADDMVKVSACDLFLYVGGTSDGWVKDALKESANPKQKTLNLLEAMGANAKEEEVVEGMEAEDDHEEGEGHNEEGPEYDEHVWLSLKNAEFLCGKITEALCEADPTNKDSYTANRDAYTEKLDALDEKYQEAVSGASVKTLLFGDRFPFRYLVDDYSLSYYAAFAGCSAETEASFETIVFLARKADELGLSVILTIDGSDGSIARTIREATTSRNQTILTLNSLQSVTARDAETGTTYLSLMESNLETLKQALK